MKIAIYVLLILAVMLSLAGRGFAAEQRPDSSLKATAAKKPALVIYYSYSGNTKRVAERLSVILEADVYEIRAVKSYPNDNHETARISRDERRTGNLPEITSDLPDISTYQKIFIGGPIWNAYIPTPLARYLELTDLSGKSIAPFWTDNGSGEQGYVADFNKRAKNPLKIIEGLGITNSQNITDRELDEILSIWLLKMNS